ncbi:hypothetical protein [Saccharothrix sp.]|uniref:hypothetical protein n=1 Tax=Saccharothrix sp. TaxID=1873460 RepID=UPI002810DD3C|nr:hypothetical protein [Saccharothrix sp.]
MKRFGTALLTTAALAVGVVAASAGTAAAEPDEVTLVQCLLGGGLPLPDEDGTGATCRGGEHDGAPVTLPELPTTA